VLFMKTFVDHLFTYFPKSSGMSDANSRTMLAFKDGCQKAAASFEKLILDWVLNNIEQHHMVCTIPSSKAGKVNQITKTCKALCAKSPWLIDATDCIKKRKSHASFCKTGMRDAFMLARSLSVTSEIKGKHILLIDDVTSTGISMYVTEKLLYDQGALSVTCLAIAETYKIYH
jgi:predicted amidophosphoribosyltransferase